MFDIKHDILNDHVHKYMVLHSGRPVSYADALEFWRHDEAFRNIFISLLTDSPFMAYRWETPPITNETVNRGFEFVLLNSSGLARTPDMRTFADQFSGADNDGVVVFENLGKDAVLVVPSPVTSSSSYAHLAAFIRSAPDSQKQMLWRAVGEAVRRRISARPLWLSTAGAGVAWLHVRLDSRPKYYGHAPYKEFP